MSGPLTDRMRLGNDALSHQAKAGVRPVPKPDGPRVCDCDRACMLTRAECGRKRIKCRYRNGAVRPR